MSSYRPGRTREKLREVVGPDQTQDHRGEEGVVWRSTQRPRVADPQCVADDQTRLVVLRPPSGVRQQDVCGRLVPFPHQRDEDLAGVLAFSKVDQVFLRKLAQDSYHAKREQRLASILFKTSVTLHGFGVVVILDQTDQDLTAAVIAQQPLGPVLLNLSQDCPPDEGDALPWQSVLYRMRIPRPCLA